MLYALLWRNLGLGRGKISGCVWPQLKVLQEVFSKISLEHNIKINEELTKPMYY